MIEWQSFFRITKKRFQKECFAPWRFSMNFFHMFIKEIFFITTKATVFAFPYFVFLVYVYDVIF